ncbi:MAG: shikimate dehydrogenase [Candidatus Lokiarchaeota archaeon]|nr:shikimate dehydrogenase [Candidatus Lokiarchaeota archaeon]
MTFAISGTTKIFCLIGHPVEHSMSPTMWNAALQELGLDYTYVAFDVESNNLENAIKSMRALGIKGMNVTIPHKEAVIKYMDEVEEVAMKMGAINTIKNDNGVLKARNTDAGGALKSLIEAGCKISGKNVLFLGSGGVARSVAYILSNKVNKIILTDIVEKNALSVANEIKKNMGANIEGKLANLEMLKKTINDIDILINATPIGMHPKIDNTPIPKELLHEDLFVFDVIYNPLKTKLLKEASEIGCKTLGGLDMLVNQGVLAFEWWTGKNPNSTLMKSKIIEFLGLRQ